MMAEIFQGQADDEAGADVDEKRAKLEADTEALAHG